MANQDHLDRLKQMRKGAWVPWRREHRETTPDLSGADLRDVALSCVDLSGADLRDADLSDADLRGSNLRGAKLIGTKLINADLTGRDISNMHGDNMYGNEEYLCAADLRDADLSHADLSHANLKDAKLIGAKLVGANLSKANLSHALLRGADLSHADLWEANLSGIELLNTDFTNAKLYNTIFANTNLSKANGLASVQHDGPSSTSSDTLYKSKGQIPESFLRGCGLSDWEIESAKLYSPNLSNEQVNDILYRIHDLRVGQAIQIHPLFISYSHADGAFVDAIETRLTKQGVRFWRDVHHAVAGRLERQIDQAIHLSDVVLLVLSSHSANSDWVEHEVRKAREKEKRTGKDALCPVSLDDNWKICTWPERLREQIMEYNILDFAKWQDAPTFQKTFAKLLEGLNLFYE